MGTKTKKKRKPKAVDHEYEVAYELAWQAAEESFRSTFDTDEAFEAAMDVAMSESGKEPKGVHRIAFDKAFEASFDVVCKHLRHSIEAVGHHAKMAAGLALGIKQTCGCGGEIEPNPHDKPRMN